MFFYKRILLGMAFAVSVIVAGNALAVDLLYDFEGDSSRTATDKLTADGSQNGYFLRNVTFQTAGSGIVPFGMQSVQFTPVDSNADAGNVIEVPGSITLGESFTLAMHANNLEEILGHTRLFSSYSGGGGVGADRIILDYDPSGSVLTTGIRAIVNNSVVEPAAMPSGLSASGYHHYALTADAGTVTIYFDGAVVASGSVGNGYSLSASNIFIGEDVGGLGIEQFYGNIDDVLVTDQVLTAAQIANLAAGSSVQDVMGVPSGALAVNYTFEGDSGTTITDKFTADGAQNGIAHNDVGVDGNAARAKLGSASGRLSPNQFSQIGTGVSGTDLGESFTLSAVINVAGDGYVSEQLTRLFSTYAGSGSAAGRLIVDFEPDASSQGFSLRALLPDGTSATSSADSTFTYNENHTLTTVYDQGALSIYIDGVQVGSAETSGVVDLGVFQLMIGEDRDGIVNEQFVGTMDDVLILSRAISGEDVLLLHQLGADAWLAVPEPGTFIILAGGVLMLIVARRKKRI